MIKGVPERKAGDNDGHVDYFKNGVEHHRNKDYAEAVNMYLNALDFQGHDKKTFVLLGNSYYMLKEHEKAKECYFEALSLDPNYVKAYYNLGIVLEETGSFEEALEAYLKTIDLDKDFQEAYSSIGDLFRIKGDLERAADYYLRGLDHKKAVEGCRKGLEALPKDLVERVKDKESFEKAQRLFLEGLRIEEVEGDLNVARESYEKALAAYPRYIAPFLLLSLPPMNRKVVDVKNNPALQNLLGGAVRDLGSPSLEILGKRLGGIEIDHEVASRLLTDLGDRLGDEKEGFDLFDITRKVLFEEPHRELEALIRNTLEEHFLNKDDFESLLKKAPYLIHAKLLYGLLLESYDLDKAALETYESLAGKNLGYINEEWFGKSITELLVLILGNDRLLHMRPLNILEEFMSQLLSNEGASLKRFIRYKLSLEAEAKLKYGFEREFGGDDGDAITAYEEAVSIDPLNPISHYVLGLAYETRGLEKEAMAQYEMTRAADFRGLESSEDVTRIIQSYISKTTQDGHPVGDILTRYFEIIADDPENMLELLSFIEDLDLQSISRIIKSSLSTDFILEKCGKVVRDRKDFSGSGKVLRDHIDFGEDLDNEEDRLIKSIDASSVEFELVWKYKTSRSIRAVGMGRDGRPILAGSENGALYSLDRDASLPWRIETGVGIMGLDVSLDSSYSVVYGRYSLWLFDLKTGDIVWKKDFERPIRSASLSGNGDLVILSVGSSGIICYNSRGEEVQAIQGSYDNILNTGLSEDGGILSLATAKTLHVISKYGLETKKASVRSKDGIQALSMSPEGDFIGLGTRDGDVLLMDKEGNPLWRRAIMSPIYGVSVSREGRVAVGTMNGFLVLYSREGDELLRYQTGENIWDVSLSSDGDYVAVGCGLVFGNVYLFKIDLKNEES